MLTVPFVVLDSRIENGERRESSPCSGETQADGDNFSKTRNLLHLALLDTAAFFIGFLSSASVQDAGLGSLLKVSSSPTFL